MKGICLNSECNQEFEPTLREQGGGRIQKYCSIRCCQRDWYLRTSSDDSSHIRYTEEHKEKTKVARQKNQLQTRCKNHGITRDTFYSELERQHYRCLGCQKELDESTAQIDHLHTENKKDEKVRGLLCGPCNRALGQVKDSPKVLYNLIAYLQRDRTKTYIYLIGALKNPTIPHLGNKMRGLNFEVFDQWWGAGPEADIYWQEYSKIKGLTYKEALKDLGSKQVFNFDRSHLEMSDIGVLVLPAGKSGHLELGYLAGLGKQTYILADGEPDKYDVMPQFANQGVFYNEEQLLKALDANR